MPDAPVYYKLLPRGGLGGAPRGVPDAAHRQAQYAVAVLQQQLGWCHGVEIRWFGPLTPADRPDDPGVFAAAHALRGCVDPDAPTEARLNVVMAQRPPAQLIRTTCHEAIHAEELSRGLDRRLTPEALEQLTVEVTELLCDGVPA